MGFDGIGLGTAPTFEKEFRNTHARVDTATICSVRVAPAPPQTRGIRRDYRGTQIDADDSRGTRVMITNLVTTCKTLSSQVGGRGFDFCAAENDPSELSPL